MKKVKRLNGKRKHEKYSLFTSKPHASMHGSYVMYVYRKPLLRELKVGDNNE